MSRLDTYFAMVAINDILRPGRVRYAIAHIHLDTCLSENRQAADCMPHNDQFLIKTY